jgi:hypothetical protein
MPNIEYNWKILLKTKVIYEGPSVIDAYEAFKKLKAESGVANVTALRSGKNIPFTSLASYSSVAKKDLGLRGVKTKDATGAVQTVKQAKKAADDEAKRWYPRPIGSGEIEATRRDLVSRFGTQHDIRVYTDILGRIGVSVKIRGRTNIWHIEGSYQKAEFLKLCNRINERIHDKI